MSVKTTISYAKYVASLQWKVIRFDPLPLLEIPIWHDILLKLKLLAFYALFQLRVSFNLP